MPVRRITAASLITALIYAPFAIGAEGPSVAAPIVCAAPGVNNRVMTHVATSLQSPRVFFKATGPEYYVDMHHGAGDEWWAVLPAVEPSTRAITYRAAAQDAKGNWVSGTAMTINTSGSCPVSSMSDTDIAAANNIVLGLTTPDESPVPAGFSCKGVKTIIAANGQMRPAEECRVALARLGGVGVAGAGGAGAAAVSTVGPGGLSLAALAALTIGGAAAGYAVYKNNQGNNKNISPSRP